MPPEIRLSIATCDRIAGFLGYGSPSASVWFLGLEEGFGPVKPGSADEEHNIRVRGTFSPTMDLVDAHRLLHRNGRPMDHETQTSFTNVWLFMAKFMLTLQEEPWSRGGEEVKCYVREKLGRESDSTFLTELSPIPCKGASERKAWLEWFMSQDVAFVEKIRRRRLELQRLLMASPPDLVVCYSLPRKQEFADLLATTWNEVREKIFVGGDGRFVLLPFFGNGQVSDEIVKTAAVMSRAGYRERRAAGSRK
jgi:hypothetical protein